MESLYQPICRPDYGKAGHFPLLVGKLGTCILLTMAGNFLASLLSGWAFETMSHHLRMGFAKHLLHLKLEDSEELSVGEQMSLLQNEIGEVSTYLGDNFGNLVNTIAAFTITLSYLLIKSPFLTLVSNLPVVLIVGYTYCSSKIISSLSRQSQEMKQEMNGVVESTVNVMPVVHIYNCMDYLNQKYQHTGEQWRRMLVKEEKVKALHVYEKKVSFIQQELMKRQDIVTIRQIR